MKILITGANGFIGKNLVTRIQSAHETIFLTRQTPDTLGKDGSFPMPNMKNVITQNLLEPFDSSLLPNDIDAIIHLAQSKNYSAFPEHAKEVFDINVASTFNFLNYAVNSNVKYFLYASSGSVYSPYARKMDENSPIQTNDFYANSKYISEKLLSCFREKIKTCCFRIFFPYGIFQKQQFMNRIINNILLKKEIEITGDNNGMIFTPTYVNDIAELMLQATEKHLQGIVNISSGHCIDMRNLCNTLVKMLSSPSVKFNYSPNKPKYKITPCMDNFHNLFPEFTFTSLSDGLSESIPYYKSLSKPIYA
jgi:UDP-glucose 4-epimerase